MTLGVGIEQLYVFALFWALGVGFSLIYLFFEGLMRSRLAAAIFDGVYGCFAVWAVWSANLNFNNGQMRAYIFVALALGCATTLFTCKRTLDKLSALLYNWFTKIQAEQNEQDFLQKINVDSLRGGNADTGVAGVHVAGNTYAVEQSQTEGGQAQPNDRSGKRRRAKQARAHRLSENGRICQKMGRKTQSHKR